MPFNLSMADFKKQEFKKKKNILIRVFSYIFKLIFSFFIYPFKVAKRYKRYNGAISAIFNEIRNNTSLSRLRTRNSALINFGIYLPIFLAFFVSFIFIYSHKRDYSKYYKTISRPIYSKDIKSKAATVLKRIKFAYYKNPVNKADYVFFFVLYSISILNSSVLALNPAFEKEDEIREVLRSFNFLNQDGEPWKVVWTPEVIMFDTFGQDPTALVHNKKFWTSINFSPDNPKIFKSDMMKFCVQKRYSLPNIVTIEYREGKEYGS